MDDMEKKVAEKLHTAFDEWYAATDANGMTVQDALFEFCYRKCLRLMALQEKSLRALKRAEAALMNCIPVVPYSGDGPLVSLRHTIHEIELGREITLPEGEKE